MADKKAGTENAAAALKVHHLRPAPGAKTAKTRVGRGEGSKGKTAGRGTKGTKARYQVPESFQGDATSIRNAADSVAVFGQSRRTFGPAR